MANIKRIRIEAVVPFCWLDAGNGAADADVARVGRLLLSPSIGLTHAYVEAGWREHPATSGKTALYRLFVHGCEALSYAYTDSLRATLTRLGAEVVMFEVHDVEAC